MGVGRLLAALVILAPVACSPAVTNVGPEPLYEDILRKQVQPKNEPRTFPESKLAKELQKGGHGGAQRLPPLPIDDDDDSGTAWKGFLSAEIDSGSSASVGPPNRGHLQGGHFLPERGTGFLRKNDKAPYGTDETVALIAWACAEIDRLYPGTASLVVGDISKEGGGKLRPHKSHQSGRDVDLGFYFLGNRKVRHFEDGSKENLDVEKTWSLLELLFATNQVEYIFIDRRFHQLFYDEAVRRGWSGDALARMFEAPLGTGKGKGYLRHARGHVNHMHVRFVCPPDDQDCE